MGVDKKKKGMKVDTLVRIYKEVYERLVKYYTIKAIIMCPFSTHKNWNNKQIPAAYLLQFKWVL